jgi:DNA-binding winged helix-turn-helix (wHTH) protein
MVDTPKTAGGALPTIAFGPFRLDIARRRLTREGANVPLGARALDLLIALAIRPGEVVTHDELMELVWPRLTVEAVNLRAQVAILRRTLGGSDANAYVATVTGRGYSFVAPILRETRAPSPPLRRVRTPRTLAIGREPLVRALASRLRTTRLLTILGPGGIGKTTLVHALSIAVEDVYADGVVFVDLADADDPSIALSSALGLAIPSRDAVAGVIAYLAPLHMLLVFDSCERRAKASGELAGRIMDGAVGVRILATSREAL